MATVSLTSTATVTLTPVGRPNVIWTLTSTMTVTLAPVATKPHVLNVNGGLGLIPYYDINLP